MTPTTTVTQSLAKKLHLAQRVPPPPAKLALQIVPVQLRVWLADQNDVACRPWYILCLELYPRGKVINHTVHYPASEKPSSTAIINFLIDHILEPPEGEERYRPTHVSFVDSDVTAALKLPLKRLGIEVGTLTIADGVDDYVKKFSTKLVQMDKASRGDAAERPGLLSVPGVTESKCADLAKSSVEMYRSKPWKQTPEHIALEVKLPREEQSTYRKRFYVTILGSDEKIYGFALLASLNVLRNKYRRTVLKQPEDMGNSSDEEDVPGKSVQMLNENDVLLCAACGKRVGETVSDDGGLYVERCTGCRRLLYCGERCQKLDWRERHKQECRIAATDAEYVFKREEWSWMRRELALLFLDPTAVPFDDLDASEEHNWSHVEEASPPLYPLPFVTIQGSTSMSNRIDRPTASEVEIMTLVASALTESGSPPPPDGILHLSNGVSMLFAENLQDSLRAAH